MLLPSPVTESFGDSGVEYLNWYAWTIDYQCLVGTRLAGVGGDERPYLVNRLIRGQNEGRDVFECSC